MIIVGILALLAFVGYNQYSQKARASEARAGCGSVKGLIEAHFAQNGTMPTSPASTGFPTTAISGKYYSDYTFTGACDATTGRYAGTITPTARAGSPTGMSITYAADGTTTEAGWP